MYDCKRFDSLRFDVMTCIVKIFLFVNLIATFTINVFAYDKSMTEILKDDGEISLLYTNGTNRFIKREDDVKAFALVESYKSHLYEIRHSGNMPILADYTNDYYAESVYTTILTELAKFTLRNGHYSSCSDVISCGGDIKNYTYANYNYLMFVNTLNRIMQNDDKYEFILKEVSKSLIATGDYDPEKISNAESDIYEYIHQLRLNGFIENIKKAQLKKSAGEFINELRYIDAEMKDNWLNIDVSYKNIYNNNDDIKYYFAIKYNPNGSMPKQEVKLFETEYPVDIHGISNLGKTCWFSSSMQFLNASRDFREFIESAAKIYRNMNEEFYELDNIFIMLNNTFNLINSNISLEPEACEIEQNGTATGYSKRIIEKQFSRLMNKLGIPINNQNGTDSATFMDKILIEIKHALQVEKSIQDCALNALYTKLEDSFNVFTTVKLKCNQGHVISIKNNASSIMLINIDEYKGKEKNDKVNELFKLAKNTAGLAFCKKCEKECELHVEIERQPAEDLIIRVNADDKREVHSAKLNTEWFVCPTNVEVYNLRASLWYKTNETDITQNHGKTIIFYNGSYVVANDSLVKKVSDSYETIIPESESEPLVLYERVN